MAEHEQQAVSGADSADGAANGGGDAAPQAADPPCAKRRKTEGGAVHADEAHPGHAAAAAAASASAGGDGTSASGGDGCTSGAAATEKIGYHPSGADSSNKPSSANAHGPATDAARDADGGEAGDSERRDAGNEAKKMRTGYDWYREVLGAPRHVCAPMVDQSELPFRLLCLDYGTDLCYTPMINSKMYTQGSKKWREKEFSADPAREQGRLIAQLCGDCPDTVLEAARLVVGSGAAQGGSAVAGVDLNCGCPQGIARKGHYGSYLLQEPDLICAIVKKLVDSDLGVPVTVKMRKVSSRDDYQDTLRLCERLVGVGASALTLHGRTKEEKGHHTKAVDWEAIRLVRERCTQGKVPLFANGGVHTYTDVVRCFEATGCDAVMSSEALLENPQLFMPAKGHKTQDEIMQEYLGYAEKCGTRLKTVKSHAFHFLYAGLQTCTDVRDQVARAKSVAELRQACERLKERREADLSIPQLGWYMRYRQPLGK
eukprot:gene41-56_t